MELRFLLYVTVTVTLVLADCILFSGDTNLSNAFLKLMGIVPAPPLHLNLMSPELKVLHQLLSGIL